MIKKVNRRAFIALGGNVGEVRETLAKACALITRRIGPILAASPCYRTAPLNPEESPNLNESDFLNAVVSVECDISPEELLTELLRIELECGRDRSTTPRWGPRPLDLDILAIDNLVLKSERLTVPHPEMHRRDFVLVPLQDIAPDFLHPILNKTATELLTEFCGTATTPRYFAQINLLSETAELDASSAR